MDSDVIDTDSLEEFLVTAVPSFREACLRGRLTLGNVDNFYLLLMDFKKHIIELYTDDPRSIAFRNALGALSALIERGTPSVKDAAIIQVVDVIIQNRALKLDAREAGFGALTAALDQQASEWEEFRKRQGTLAES